MLTTYSRDVHGLGWSVSQVKSRFL